MGIRLVNDSIDFTSALAVLILAPEVYFPLRNAASLFHASADGSQALEQLQEIEKKKSASIDLIDCDFSQLTAVSWSQWGLRIPGRESSVIEAHTAKKGELHFILGESGVGKSTFALNLLGITHEAEVIVEAGSTQRRLTPELNSSWLKNLGWIPQLPHQWNRDSTQPHSDNKPIVCRAVVSGDSGVADFVDSWQHEDLCGLNKCGVVCTRKRWLRRIKHVVCRWHHVH